MNITLLSGAYKNAGDFLIVKRCKDLINSVFPESKIVEYKRRNNLSDNLDEINKTDVLILAGGPAYVERMYPNVIPLVDDLDKIKVPIFAMAMGWKGYNGFPETVYNYGFSDSTMKLLKRIENDGYSLGCRDYFSERVLNKQGIKNTIMTGCAAWHDLKFCGKGCSQSSINQEIKRIYVSDPALMKNYSQFIDLIKFLKTRYPNVEIKVLFHRGISADQDTPQKLGAALRDLCSKLKELKIPYDDISYGYEGFEEYNKCDMHIGYRVHAHIFNLSQRRRSILIQEDGRGAGVNQAVGLREIYAYNVQKEVQNLLLQRCFRKINLYGSPSNTVCLELNDYLMTLENNDYIQFQWAFERMNFYYDKMREHLMQLNNLEKSVQ